MDREARTATPIRGSIGAAAAPPPDRRGRVLPMAGALLAAVLTLSACGDDDSGPTLSVYSGRHYDVELAFERFEEDTGVEVEFLTGNDAELRERIAAEGEDTEADVYLTVDAGNLATAAADGLFQPLAFAGAHRRDPARLPRPRGSVVRPRRAGPHDRVQP